MFRLSSAALRAVPAMAGVFLVLGAIGLAHPAWAVDPVNKSFLGGVAIKGYDPVAYFTQGEAVEGSDEYEFEWMEATWRFASAENRDLFAAAPEKYAPQYGGYCAYAVSQGGTANIDPTAWKIVDGKLYLNLSHGIQEIWAKDIPGYIKQADINWPRILGES